MMEGGGGEDDNDQESSKNVLAEYSIPIGSNEAKLQILGAQLSVEDFDALIEYVELFKKQFVRKEQADQHERKMRAMLETNTAQPSV